MAAGLLQFGFILSALASLWLALFSSLPGPGSVPRHLAFHGAFTALAAGLAWLLSRAFQRRPAAWTRPRVVALLAPVWLAWAWLLAQGSSQLAGPRHLESALGSLAAAWLLGALACLSGGLPPPQWLDRAERAVLALSLLPLFLALRLFSGPAALPLAWVLPTAAAAAWAWSKLPAGPRHAWGRWDWAGLALLFAAMVPTRLPYEAYSMAFYLGPLNGLRLGLHSLVDVYCQYGPGVVLFLGCAFKALGCQPLWVSFSFVHLLAYLAWFAGLAWLLRGALRSRALAWACLALLLPCAYYLGPGMQRLAAPSVGPLRFGPPLLVLVAGYARLRRDRPGWAAGLLAWLALLLTAGWSLEVFVFGLAGAVGLRLWELWGRPGWGRRLGLDALALAAALGLGLAGVELWIRAGAGVWPDWGPYAEQLGLYGGGLMAQPLVLCGPWVLFPALALGSLVALIRRRVGRAGCEPEEALMAGLSLQALAEFSYYLMRAHPNNLLNLSPLYLVLAFYWVDQWASRPADGPLRLLPLGLLALGLSAALWACAPALAGGLSHSLLGLGRQAPDAPDAEEAGAAPWSQVWRPVPLSPQSAAAVALLHADAPGQARVAVFLKPCLDVDVHLLSRTLDAFPVTNLAEDGNGPRRRARILALPDAIQAGDLVLAGADERGGWDGPPAKSSPLGADLWRRTRARFIWSPQPGAEQGVMAFRLEARP